MEVGNQNRKLEKALSVVFIDLLFNKNSPRFCCIYLNSDMQLQNTTYNSFCPVKQYFSLSTVDVNTLRNLN